MITLSASAVKELTKLLESKQADPDAGLRLSVQRGGCAGMQYIMKIENAEPGDETIAQDGARVHIAADAFEYLRGCHLIYEYSLSDSGFKIQNPNASRSCGCGTSFEAKEAGDTEPKYDPALDGTKCS
jgi:iron-sulfur cluster assembly protein